MFITYGVSDNGELISVDLVPRGKTALKCPYCGGLLLARKGQIKVPHFAHAGETCAAAKRNQDIVSLPAYEHFNLNLPGKVVEELYKFHSGIYSRQLLEEYELIQFNGWAGRGSYELTKKGKLVLGELSLNLFIQFQEPLILAHHDELQQRAQRTYENRDRYQETQAKIAAMEQVRREQHAKLYIGQDDTPWTTSWELRQQYHAQEREYEDLGERIKWLRPLVAVDYETALVDLHLYRVQWQRILKCSLYFLRINEGQLYKIGVTMRPVEQRVAEIAADLLPHLGVAKIEVLGTWPGRGNVEFYFKHRYKANNFPLGQLTEYFKFDDEKAVLRDLRRMQKKEFTDLELGVLRGVLSPFEEGLWAADVEQKRRQRIGIGLRRSAARGRTIGRPKGKQSEAAILAKYPTVVEVLQAGKGVRAAARETGVAINTVQKVRAALVALDIQREGDT